MLQHITSAQFIKGSVGTDNILQNSILQVAFIGRSNAGKSSLINALTNQKGLAVTSSFPGRTQQMNIFLINKVLYFVDLPGYGFVRISPAVREKLQKMIDWYLFRSDYNQKYVVLIIDASLGPTDLDMDMLYKLEAAEKNIIVVANKIDKIKKPNLEKQISDIQSRIGSHTLLPISAEKKIGIADLVALLLK
jgi:GTP-binding protein